MIPELPMRLIKIRYLATSLLLLIASSFSHAEGFEGTGLVEEIELSKGLITVAEEIFYLPNSILVDGSPAIFQLQRGYQVNFSGKLGGRYPVIQSIYIDPESVLRAQRSRYHD